MSLNVGGNHPVADRLQRDLGALLLLEQLDLGMLATGDVAHDHDDCRLPAPDRERGGDLDGNFAAVLAHGDSFILARHGLALEPALIAPVYFRLFIRTHQIADGEIENLRQFVSADFR